MTHRLTVFEFSQEVGRSHKTILRWIHEGYIDSAKVWKIRDGYMIEESEVSRIAKPLTEEKGGDSL